MDPVAIMIAALILASMNLIGILFPLKIFIPRRWWLSFSGGIAVGYVFIHLIPEIIKVSGSTGEQLTFSITLMGTLIYFGASKVAKSRRRSGSSMAFIIQMVSLVPYFLLIGYYLNELGSIIALISYTLAIGLHLVGFGYDLREDHKERYSLRMAGSLGLSLLLGSILSLIFRIRGTGFDLLLAFLTGGILLNSIKEEIPPVNRSKFWAFASGAIITGLLLIISI